jgi:hypothetical protein
MTNDKKIENKHFKTGQEIFLEQACYVMIDKPEPFCMIINGKKYELKLTRLD